MSNLLQLVFEYRRLLAKSDAIAGSLRPPASRRLKALEKLFGKEPAQAGSDRARRFARCELRLPATVRVNDRVQPVSLVNLGGGGVCVSPAPNLQAGEIALLRIVAEDQSKVYQYQVRQCWASHTGTASQMGMPFVGIPRTLRVDEELSPPNPNSRAKSTVPRHD